MSFVVLLLLLLVIAGITVVAAGSGGSLAPAEPERGPRGTLPDGAVDRVAVDGLRFTLAFRGYRMDEVDDVLARLGRELEERDLRLAELEGRPVGAAEVEPSPSTGADARRTGTVVPADAGVDARTESPADAGADAWADSRADGRG